MSFGLETGELPNPEAPWAWRSSAVAAGVPWGVFLPQLHLVTDSHKQGHLSQPRGSGAGADGVHQGLSGVHWVAEGA